MKKLYVMLIFAFILSACSFSLSQPTPVATSAPTRVLSPTPSPTITPTKPLPTFTSTPTLTGYKSPTPTPLNTLTPTVTVTLTSIFSNVTPPTSTPNVTLEGFLSVVASSNVVYLTQECAPASVKFTVQTEHKTKASYVVLFARFVSKTSGAKSEWTSITMNNEGMDVFTYTLIPSEMKAIDSYVEPWIEYQFVATTAANKEVGRTGVFKELLSLLKCVLTPTPTPTVTATPPLKP